MAVTLTRRGDSTLPLDFRGISPAGLRGKSASEIESLPILHGNRQTPLAEHFSVATGGAGDLLVLAGDCRAVHGIGSGLESGSIRVEGEAGRHCGAEMRGGSLEILGSAGDWLGAEMRGGEIRVHGNAGNGVGAAYRGSVRGMRGGEIFIHGSAGDELGRQMRRGLIAVAQTAGELAAYEMLAGTIVLGGSGPRPGSGMRRGTLWYWQGEAPEFSPTFRRGSRAWPLALEIVRRRLMAAGFAAPEAGLAWQMHHGDMLAGGRGEVFTAA